MMTSWQGETPLVKNVLKKLFGALKKISSVTWTESMCRYVMASTATVGLIRFQTKKWPSQEILVFWDEIGKYGKSLRKVCYKVGDWLMLKYPKFQYYCFTFSKSLDSCLPIGQVVLSQTPMVALKWLINWCFKSW